VLGKENISRILSQNKSKCIAISSVSATKDNKHLSDYNCSTSLSDETLRHFAALYNLQYTILRYTQISNYKEMANKNQGAIYHFIDSFRNNKPLNVFGNADMIRSYIPTEVLVKTVRKTIEEKIPVCTILLCSMRTAPTI
jgi:nucleoside-diphosphate-sugar epimerase